MSWYTVFDVQESLLTSSTTTVLASTDAVLMHSYVDGKKHQATVQGLLSGPESLQVLTSASTATNIVPYGVTTLQSSNAISFLLTAPLANNTAYQKIISTSSTATITVVCSGATLHSTGAPAGSQFVLNSAGAAIAGGSVSLVSLGTTHWVTLGYSGTTVFT